MLTLSLVFYRVLSSLDYYMDAAANSQKRMSFIFICWLFFITLAFTWLTTLKKPGLVLENLSAGYQKKIIVDDISLAIPQQKMTVLVGANGCGKSTLLSTLARLASAARRQRRCWTAKPSTRNQPKRSPASSGSCRSRRCCRKG